MAHLKAIAHIYVICTNSTFRKCDIALETGSKFRKNPGGGGQRGTTTSQIK